MTWGFEQNVVSPVYLTDIYGKSHVLRERLAVKIEKKFGVIGKNNLESKLVVEWKFNGLSGV